MSDIERKIPRSWFRAQTQSTTMSILTSSAQARFAPLTEGQRQLGWFVLPAFQRPPVWTPEQKVRLIESCWMGLPIGSIVYNRLDNPNSTNDSLLLDGQQRVTAILEYMADAYPVYGYLYSELADRDHRQWEMGTPLPSMVTNIDDEDELREVYDRLAYGGTPHEPKE